MKLRCRLDYHNWTLNTSDEKDDNDRNYLVRKCLKCNKKQKLVFEKYEICKWIDYEEEICFLDLD